MGAVSVSAMVECAEGGGREEQMGWRSILDKVGYDMLVIRVPSNCLVKSRSAFHERVRGLRSKAASHWSVLSLGTARSQFRSHSRVSLSQLLNETNIGYDATLNVSAMVTSIVVYDTSVRKSVSSGERILCRGHLAKGKKTPLLSFRYFQTKPMVYYKTFRWPVSPS